tara:strand:+ start:1499 stop:2002 length:504 start_codon:yes stop_codon:yes gene_type:complete
MKQNTLIRLNKILVILIFYVFLKYVLDLEKNDCSCSSDWKRDYIKYFSIAIIILSPLEALKPDFFHNNKNFTLIYYLLQFIFSVIFLISSILYIKELREKKCKCSEDHKRTFMEVYSYIFLILYSIIIITIFQRLIKIFILLQSLKTYTTVAHKENLKNLKKLKRKK